MKRILAAIIVLVTLSGIAVAQTGGDRPATIEELYLSQEIGIQIIASQARSNDRDAKLQALETARELFESGNLVVDDALLTVVESLATEGSAREVRSGGRVINYFPVVRKEAAALLGDMGGTASKNILLTIVREDPEPMVLAEAIYALGKIGINDDSEVTDHLVYVLTRENAKFAPDNNLALATLLALEKLVEQGGELDVDSVGLIIDLSTNYRYMSMVRDRAAYLLGLMTGRQ